MKKLFLSLAAAFTAMSVYADDVSATFALTSGAAEEATVSAENVFSGTSMSVGGSRLSISGTQSYSDVTYTKVNNGASDKSTLTDDYVRFALTPKKGITFVPTKVSFGACRFGTDAGVVRVVVNDTEIATNINPGRNKSGSENEGYSFSYNLSDISCTSTSPCHFDMYINTNNGKALGVTNVVIEGTYSGEAEEEVMYTISTSVNIDGAGTIAQNPAGTSIVEKNSVTFTATANTGYKFVNWTDDLENILSSTADYTIESVEANVGVIANFVALPKVTFAKAGEELGNVPAVVYCEVGAEVVLPKNQTLYKEGSTFAGWTDGENTYAAGASVTVNGDVTFTATYAENTVALADAVGEEPVVSNWTFARNSGAPTINCENSETYYVNQVTVNGTAIDLAMYVNTKDGAVIEGQRGKLNNTSDASKAQVNMGTAFTIPAVSGMTVEYVCTVAPSDNSAVTFGGTTGTLSEKTISYTYEGSDATLLIAAVESNLYPSGITVTYPVAEAPFEFVDCTASVPTDGWKSDVGSVGSYTKDVAQKEQYLTNTTTNGEILYQTVEGLANGTYTVELYANASYTSGRGFTSAALNGELGRAIVYAGDVEKTIPVVHQTAVGTNNIVTLENVVVSDGTLKMGLRKDVEGSNWHTIQIKSLTQTSDKAEADAAAQDEYWKGIAATVAAYEAYANIAGAEKAAIAAAETKAAAQAAIAPFYAAKDAYDALVQAIADASAAGVDAADAKAVLASAETTAAAATEALHLVKLAVNTSKATEGADMTSAITNPSFENGTTGWTYETSNDHGAKETSNATYTMTNCDGNYLFNIWSSGNAISQKVEDLPNGTYILKATIATDGGQKVQLNANDKSIQIDATDKGTGVEGQVEFNVLDNTATIGAEGVNKYWYKVDNFRLTFVKGFDMEGLTTAYNDALAEAQAVTGNMNADVKTALEAAIAAEVDKTNGDALAAATTALAEATSAAKASATAYASASEKLAAMKALIDATNVYTAEALATYYTQWVEKYEAKTLTTAEANALQDPTTVTGWHADITVDNFLLSAWDTNPDFTDAPYYINTWSTEGNTDGSNFKVPFFEYWVADANSLGEKTLTATLNGVAAGNYAVSAWVRVRIKNDAEAPASGITFQANEGEAVNVADGAQIGTSQFYLKEVTAEGTVGEDGVLTVKFNVAADNNVSWLSFKNVKFEEIVPAAEDIELTLESGKDIATELAAAIEGKKVGNITINLAEGGSYTISASIVAPASLTINGNGATVDASALAANFIEMAVVENPTEWTEANVTIKGVTVKGLAKALF
ncbi:MAG: InlB B-repeat-containing protein, partial [Bacteroidales bacterium]|nr:InlB B-repeat-containing protein [Bacteroidales bacterium]